MPRSPRNRPEVAQRLRVERHQLVIARLAERVGDLLGAHRAQLGGRPRAGGPEAVGERPGDREVAGDRVPLMVDALAQRREPARAEVDRVERQEVRRDVRRASRRAGGARRPAAGAGPGSSAASASRSIVTERACAAIRAQDSRTSSGRLSAIARAYRRRRSRPYPEGFMPDAAADERIEHLLEGLNRAPARGRRRTARGRCSSSPAPARARRACSPTGSPTCSQTGRARPSEILAITFTNKAAGEMRERVELLLGAATRAMWVMTFHSRLRADPARRGAAARLHAPVHDLRRGRLAAAGQALPGRARARPEALHAAARSSARSPAPRTSCATPRPTASCVRARTSSRRSPTSTSSTSSGCTRRTRWTSTTCSVRTVNVLRAVPRGPRALPARLPPRPRRRVPGHEPRPVPAAAAARRASTAT